jgi:hypothetical protein
LAILPCSPEPTVASGPAGRTPQREPRQQVGRYLKSEKQLALFTERFGLSDCAERLRVK